MKTGWVYILECSDGTYYVGVTSDPEARVTEHEQGIGSRYTSKRLPVKFKWADEFPDMDSAIAAEKQIKGWSRQKKEALMRGDFEALQKLAECKNGSHWRNKEVDIVQEEGNHER